MSPFTMPEALRVRYEKAVHRMQSAIAFETTQEVPHLSADPTNVQRALKHMRVGVDSAFSTQKALVDLLLEKGVFSADEYFVAITHDIEREADEWVARVQIKYGLEGVDFA